MFQLSVTKHLDDPRSCKLDHWEIMVILPWVNQLWLPSGNLTLLNAIEHDLLKWWFSIAIMITTYDPWDLQGPCIISQPQSVHTESGWPGRPVSPQSWGWSRSACPRYCRPTSPPENSPLGTRVSFFFGGRNRSYLLCDVESANLLSRKIQMLAVEVANSLYIFLHLLQVRSFSKQLKNQSPFKQKCERITGWPILLGILLVCQKDGLSKIVVYLLNPRAQGFIFPMNNGQKLKKLGHGNGSETISPPTKVGLSNIDIDQYCGSR